VQSRNRASGLTDTQQGVGDLTVTLKRNLAHPDGQGFSIALAPFVSLRTYNMPSDVYMTSLSWVTGEHNLKVGLTYSAGDVNIYTGPNNGSIEQRYRNGVTFDIGMSDRW
jgi:hypothetical protein